MVRFPVPCSGCGFRTATQPSGLRISSPRAAVPVVLAKPTSTAAVAAAPAATAEKAVCFLVEYPDDSLSANPSLACGSNADLTSTDSESNLRLAGPCSVGVKITAMAHQQHCSESVECPAVVCAVSDNEDKEDEEEDEEEVESGEEDCQSAGTEARRDPAKRGSILERIRGHTRNFALMHANGLSKCKNEQLRALMDLLEPGMPLGHFSDFAKAYGDEAFCSRLLRKYPDSIPKCAEKLKQALIWREQNRVLLTTRNCPQAGDNRVIGADLGQRPVLYMCMRNQLLPLGQCVDFLMVAMLQSIDNMPAGVETMTHIWDLHGMMLRLNWNPAPLVAILKAAEGYFAERMHQLIIIDMPRMAGFIKDAVWPLVPEKTKEKVMFLTAEEAEALVGAGCPSDVAGRIRSAMAQNRDGDISLEERKRSWMRVNEQAELVPMYP